MEENNDGLFAADEIPHWIQLFREVCIGSHDCQYFTYPGTMEETLTWAGKGLKGLES